MKRAFSSGSISIVILALLGLLGIVSLRIYTDSKRLLSNISNEIKGSNIFEKNLADLAKLAVNSPVSDGISTIRSEATGLIVRATTDPTRPLFNFNKVFKNASRCTSPFATLPGVTRLGFVLSNQTSISTQNCSTIDFSHSHSVIGNLELPGVVPILASSTIQTISATGYIEFEELQINSNILVVAAGDLHIQTLSVVPSRSTRITLISGTGIVSVDSAPLGASIFVYGRRGFLIPSNVTAESGYGDMPSYDKEVIGLVTPALPNF